MSAISPVPSPTSTTHVASNSKNAGMAIGRIVAGIAVGVIVVVFGLKFGFDAYRRKWRWGQLSDGVGEYAERGECDF